MLKGIPAAIHADLMHALMQMGHGDDLLICDVNHPAASIAAETTYGRVVDLSGTDIAGGLAAILTLMPVDTFVTHPVKRMQVVGDPEKELPLFATVRRIVEAAEGRPVEIEALERFAFYAAARKAFVVVRTSDPGPYGCFIIRMGVV